MWCSSARCGATQSASIGICGICTENSWCLAHVARTRPPAACWSCCGGMSPARSLTPSERWRPAELGCRALGGRRAELCFASACMISGHGRKPCSPWRGRSQKQDERRPLKPGCVCAVDLGDRLMTSKPVLLELLRSELFSEYMPAYVAIASMSTNVSVVECCQGRDSGGGRCCLPAARTGCGRGRLGVMRSISRIVMRSVA